VSTLSPPPTDPIGSDRDPRLDPNYVRTVSSGSDAPVTLVGVVHDHPASVARVRSTVETTEHATLALELPPLALPLFEEYADDARTPPAFGGEMSAAIQASDARAVGIDGPSRRFLRTLARHVSQERPDRGAIARLLSRTRRASGQAIRCRLAASIARRTSVRVEVGAPRTYDCDPDDPPAVQAENERAHVSRARAVLRALAPPDRDRRDAVREDCMAAAIDDARRSGPVVAVVGIGHLDGLEDRLGRSDA
jgi:hypothetical protein